MNEATPTSPRLNFQRLARGDAEAFHNVVDAHVRCYLLAVGGLITGLLHLRNMRRHSRRSGWWVLANVVGWGLGWLAMDLGFPFGLLIGGALLGVVTGGAMVWLLQSPPSTEQDAGEAWSTADTASST